MTFYEAALRVLEGAGHPLHFLEITQKSIQQSLLSHVGKTPEQTMLSRLAAMARRRGDRKVIVTAKDTFALADWQLPEDAEALAQTGLPEVHPEEELAPLRPAERHPEPRVDNVRSIGRGERKRRREEEEERGRRRRYPPISEVAFEMLSEATEPLGPEEIATRARARELAGEELGPESILTALMEDNQRRIDAGRRPQFVLSKESGKLSLERVGAAPEVDPLELQLAFAQVLGLPIEGGRPVLARPRERALEPGAEMQQVQAAKVAAREARRGMARAMRRKLAELDAGTLEKAVARMMHALHFRELKVAKRSREGQLLTCRRREGSLELRYAVRLLRGTAAVDRKAIQELRRDLGHHSAHVALLISPGEVRGDARNEAQAHGHLVFLWCGEALAEKFFEAATGVIVHKVELFEPDEAFFEQARLDADQARQRREERQRQKPREEPGVAAGEPAPAEPAALTVIEGEPPPPAASLGAGAEPEEEVGEEELELDVEVEGEVASGAPGPATGPQGQSVGERKRRRRRRRGRKGRGLRPGEAGAQGAPLPAGTAPAAEFAPSPPAPESALAPPPPAVETQGGGESH